jgi:AcrR family transcriptional regulator
MPNAGRAGLRADARRNSDKILSAAHEVFAEHGAAMQMDEVARRADVGVATVYRKYPSKAALFGTLAAELFGRCLDRADTALAEGDAASAVTAFFHSIADLLASNAGLRAVLGSLPPENRPSRQNDLLDRLHALHARAVEARVIRSDLDASDLQGLVCAVSAGIEQGMLADRMADIVLKGILTGHSGL